MFIGLIIWFAHAIAPTNQRRGLHIALIVSLFIAPLIFLSAGMLIRSYQALTDISLERRQAIAIPVALALQERIARLADLGVAFGIHPRLRKLVLQEEWEEIGPVLEVFKAVADDPFLDRIVVVDAEGTLKVGIPETGTEGQNFAFRDWYTGVIQTGAPYLSEAYRRMVEPQYNVVALTIPIVDEQNAMRAILALQVRLDHFLGWSKEIAVGGGGFVYIVDQRGHIVSHPDVSVQEGIVDGSGAPVVKAVLRGERGITTAIDPFTRAEVIVAYAPVSKYGWGVMVQQSAESVFARRDRELFMLALAYALISIGYLFLVSLLLRALIRYQDYHDPAKPAGASHFEKI